MWKFFERLGKKESAPSAPADDKQGALDAALAALDVQLTDEEVAALEAPYRPHAVRGF